MFINEGRKAIEMNTAEYKAAMTYGTEEYKALREIRNDYPNFRVVELKSKKVTTSLNNIKMPFIKSYVKAHGTDKQKKDYFEMSTAHVNEYGVYIPAQSFLLIKKWFFVDKILSSISPLANLSAFFQSLSLKTVFSPSNPSSLEVYLRSYENCLIITGISK